MQPNERAEFGRLITDALGYYREDATRFTLDLWWQACQRWTLDEVSGALSRHAMDPEHGQFAPKVADIVRIISGTNSDRAQLAWGKVHEAMGSVGAYTDVVFDDPAIHAAIEDAGGWPKMCRTETKELGFLQHRFCESHKAYTGRGTFEYPRRLMGDRSPDHEYLRHGRPVPHPALIGNADRARDVYRGGALAGKTAITFAGLVDMAAKRIADEVTA